MKAIYALQSKEPVTNLSELFNKVQLNSISTYELLAGMSISFVLGLIIFIIYRITFKGSLYSYTFNLSLMLITIITALIIMTISSNLILSLGMVGALSIVRFRTAIKDPIDIVYIFWCISVGLAIGSNQYLIGFVGSSFLAIILIVTNLFSMKSKSMILIINYDYLNDTDVTDLLKHTKKIVKSKHTANNNVELTLEVKRIQDELLRSLNDATYVHNTSLLQYEN